MCKQPFIIGSQPLVLMRQLEVGIGALGQADQASKAVVAQLTGAVMQRCTVDFDCFTGFEDKRLDFGGIKFSVFQIKQRCQQQPACVGISPYSTRETSAADAHCSRLSIDGS